jgi:long-chain acyl-CoA synthetase
MTTYDEAIAELTKPGAPFEVGSAEVDGRTSPVWTKAAPSLRDLLAATERHGDREFLVYGDDRYTFGEHLRAVAGFARWLARERGVGKGDRVAIGMRNYPEWIIAFWATQALGAVTVPLNAWWTEPELRFALEDSGTTCAVLDGERYGRLAPDLADLGLPSVVVRHDGEVAPAHAHWADVAGGFDRTGPAVLPDVAIGPDDDATIIYTSGTTGRPKGAVNSQRNHVTTFLNTAFAAALQRMTSAPPPPATATSAASAPSEAPEERPRPAARPCSLMTYPFFHVGGINTIYISTGFGMKVVLQYRWEVEETLELIQREKVTSLAAVPKLLRELLESPLLDRYDVSSLAALNSGGAPVPPDLVDRIDRRGVTPGNGYGLTETTGAVTINGGDEYVGRATSVGRTFPVNEVRVVAPGSGEDLPRRAVGELWFRGPSVVRGYWRQPEATAESFTDGWFHTGDLGSVDGEGYVYVVDRLKDVVIRAGENVYCVEVEAALFDHPAVVDVAVVGLPHPELGEEVVAVVRLEAGAVVSEAELRDHVAARLAYFKVPARIVFRADDLPRTATGKVLKRELRDELGRAPAG